MKQIFDWLREQVLEEAIVDGELRSTEVVFLPLQDFVDLVDEAEAKWEADCCEWKLEDAEANLYVTKCEKRQLIFEGTPTENDYKYCPYCGRKISEVE